jgi:hypothetical protein
VPPSPIAVTIGLLVVLGGLGVLYTLVKFIGTPGSFGERLTAALGFLVLSLLTLWTARMLYLGHRGGQALATLIALVLMIIGLLFAQREFPAQLIALIPTSWGFAILGLIFVPPSARNWFRPSLWANTR